MVMVTRNAYKKASENSSNNSDISMKNIIPPWCSSGKAYESRKSKRLAAAKWEIRSTYPLRDNIWEYLYEDTGNFNCASKKRKRPCKKTSRRSNLCCTVGISIALGVMISVSVWTAGPISSTGLITKVVPDCNLISLLGMNTMTSSSTECCQRLEHLTEELSRVEQALRHTLRLRRTMLLTWRTTKTATKGSDTTELGTRVALWGVVPLWSVTPPPHTVLSPRPPAHTDCWPFVGSVGEIIIHLPRIQRVRYVSLEHIRPDTARSALKHFVLHGVLANSTRIKITNGEYRADGPAKQYYPIATESPLRGVALRVLSNQGNGKYTCVYRVHLYGASTK